MFKFLTIPVIASELGEAELNAFLQSHRVLSVQRHLVDQGSQSFWAICIDYSISPHGQGANDSRTGKGKVDYREVLSSEQFAKFAKLRDLRKRVAQTEAVPVYTIFTNEQLAEMIRNCCVNKTDLEKIAGVGDGRVAKYGAPFMELLAALQSPSDATNEPPV